MKFVHVSEMYKLNNYYESIYNKQLKIIQNEKH